MDAKILARNKKARFEYLIIETFEAGISLKGTEIKSIRSGQVSLSESFVQIEKGEAWLVGAHIAQFYTASIFNHDPKRNRKLLLHKREILKLWDAIKMKGMTIVPIELYLLGGRAKLKIAIGKGKKLFDKREVIAKRDQQRDSDRLLRLN